MYLLLEWHQLLEATFHNTFTKIKTHANPSGSFMDKLTPRNIFLQALRLYNRHSTIVRFLAIACAVGDWTGWSGCVMGKRSGLYITFGSANETILAGTSVRLTVLNLMYKRKEFWYFADRASQYIYLNINQLDALNFIMSLFCACTCFEHKCLS